MTTDRYIAPANLAPNALLRIWRSIPIDQQEAIGTLALLNVMADTVADDDGLISTAAERDAAAGPAQSGVQDLYDAVQAALPQVLWYYEDPVTYEARDRHGNVLGKDENQISGYQRC